MDRSGSYTPQQRPDISQVRRMVWRILAGYPGETCEDVAQDVWVGFLEEGHTLAELAPRELRRHVRRHARRYKRSVSRSRRWLAPDSASNGSASGFIALDDRGAAACALAPSPEWWLEGLGLAGELSSTMQRLLTPIQAQLVCARLCRGYSVATTAEALEVSQDVVKNELSRALERLRRPLAVRMAADPPSEPVIQICVALLAAEVNASACRRPPAAGDRAAA